MKSKTKIIKKALACLLAATVVAVGVPAWNGAGLYSGTETGITAYAADPVTYMGWNGTKLVEQTLNSTPTTVESSTTTWNAGWYIVSGDVTISSRITVSGTVNLILEDGAKLTASKGITVAADDTLNIYGQSGGTGELKATGESGSVHAGIGGISGNGGTVTINGGTVTAEGGADGAGIGGSITHDGGTVTINGGTVTAKGGSYGAGIGGGSSGSGGTVTINGGTVTAKGGSNCAGIGGGYNAGSHGSVTIADGMIVKAGTSASNAEIVTNYVNSHAQQYAEISGSTWQVGDTINLAGKWFEHDDDNLLEQICAANESVTIPTPRYMSSYGQWVFAETIKTSDGYENLYLSIPAGYKISDKPTGFKIKSGTGIEGDPYVFELVYGSTPAVFAEEPKAKDLTYNGKYQELVTAGTTEGGTVQYKLGEKGKYRETIPMAVGAGTYTVYYKVIGDALHTDSEEKSVTVTIAQATISLNAPEAKVLTYTGQPQYLVTPGTASVGTIEYKLGDEGAYSGAVPQATDAGTYTVYYRVPADDNITESVEGSVEVKINPMDITDAVITLSQNEFTYDGNVHEVTIEKIELGDTVLAENDDYEIAKSSVQSATYKGNYTLKIDGKGNYTGTASKEWTITKLVAEVVTPPTAKDLTYNGDFQELVTAGTATGGKMLYRLAGTSWYREDIPQECLAGKYTVYYKVDGNEVYDDSPEGSVEVTIAKAPITVEAIAKSKTFGNPDPELEYEDPILYSGDTLTGALSRVEGENVGNYNITQGTLDAGNNYEITFKSATLTINPKSINGALISLESDELVYTGSELSPRIEQVKIDDKVLVKGTDYEIDETGATNGTNQGTYTLKIKGIGNYTGTAEKTWTITKATIVTYNSQTGAAHVVSSDAIENANLIFAEYDSEGRLVSAEVKTVSVAANGAADTAYTVKPGNNTLKVMLWDSIGGMKPLEFRYRER